MNSDDLTRFKSWFADYAASYFTEDRVHDHPLRLKQEHTERVCQEIVSLGEALQISPQDMLLAETMALFHDVGRFEQYASYGTFKDAVSENHAGLGLRVLAHHKVLAPCSEEEQRLVTKSIAFHILCMQWFTQTLRYHVDTFKQRSVALSSPSKIVNLPHTWFQNK